MLPLFKSDFSIGKSILTLDLPTEETTGPTSIFSLAQAAELKQIVLIEDSLTGFLKAHKNSSELKMQLIFGLRLSLCGDMEIPIPKGGDPTEHKIVIFARTSDGCKLLNKIYSLAFTQGNGRLDFSSLKKLWSETHLQCYIPFYDSFIFNNLTRFSTCVTDFSFCRPAFFIEDNNLPFDFFVREKVEEYCSKHNYSTQLSKTIYYENKKDFAAYQTYKCICKRASYGRGATLDKPNLDHCGSNEFCFESWEENK